jgi:23S rRNA (uracil-5-)-methyltransferase rumA
MLRVAFLYGGIAFLFPLKDGIINVINSGGTEMKKNEFYTVTIEDLTHEGLGVGKVDGFPLFIENSIPGEVVCVKTMKIGKSYGYARVEEWLEVSPNRVEVKDALGTRVGTMPLQHMTYESQLAFKEQQVKNVMTKIAKMPELEVRRALGMESALGYRNKAQIPVRTVEGQLTTGFFKKNSHDLIPIEDFHIQDPEIDRLIVAVRDILRKYPVVAYDEANNTGELKHIIVRRGLRTKQVMIIFVTRTKGLPQAEAIVRDITAAHPEVVSIVQNIQPKPTNVIMGRESKVLFGEDVYEEKLFEFTFKISARSFFQVNTVQTEVLYQQAIDAADLKGGETVVDAYCGIGTMSLAFARDAKKVYAMEIVDDAIVMAKENAKLNGVTNVHFEKGAAEKIMPRWKEEGIQPEVIVVDPPRKGLDLAFIEAACATGPERIVYVSCNPATLARDLVHFKERGYIAQYVQPVDMFPMTAHVECVVLMSCDVLTK